MANDQPKQWADASARAHSLADTVPDPRVRGLLHQGIQRGDDPVLQKRLLSLTDRLLAAGSPRQLAALVAALIIDMGDEHHDLITSMLRQAGDM